jgi:hypothetical protein
VVNWGDKKLYRPSSISKGSDDGGDDDYDDVND